MTRYAMDTEMREMLTTIEREIAELIEDGLSPLADVPESILSSGRSWATVATWED